LAEKQELTLKILAGKLVKVYGIGRNVELCPEVADLKRRTGNGFDMATSRCSIDQVSTQTDHSQCYKTFYGRNYVAIGVTHSKS
jgi:hypothetical protein